MLTNLALNHSVLVSAKNGEIHYNASSPDELALVNGARFLGVTFECRDEDNNIYITIDSQKCKYELLNVLGFDSTRKRMTVIVRNTKDNLIYVMCKGADSVLLPLLRDKFNPRVKALVEQTFHFMDDYAKDGLRTLLFVEKVISEEEYTEWMLEYNRANLSLIDRDAEVERVCKLIEINFDLVGSTAIEDKLQEGVPETIKQIKKAGIKLWVLTGDKIETAVNIGYSCGLLEDSIAQYVIDASKSVEIHR